ncbi:MAG: ATPase, T2SS/T4P/T4SS family [Kiritimatiellia bacterium]
MAESRLTNILLRRQAITQSALEKAEKDASAKGYRLEKFLIDQKLVSAPVMTLALGEYLNMRPIRLARFTPDNDLIESMPKDFLAQHLVIPIAKHEKLLTLALGDPFDIVALEELHDLMGLDIVPLVASEQEIQDLLSKLTHPKTNIGLEEVMSKAGDNEVEVGQDKQDDVSLEEMLESAGGAPVIRMVNMILVEALRTRASDIHIEPMERLLRLRYRIDGSMTERPSPAKSYQAAIISRIKIMSNMNIAERRLPQDGRFKIKALGKEVDMRVSVLPTVHGEKVVMRVLDKSSLMPNLASLGLDEQAFRAMSYAINQPHGIILVTGPTGSGKTTTLYSCLQEMNQPDVNIITCEDPVEYQLEGINQVQINTDVGLTFAGALRSVLRQDPDIVLVGEIRDAETAQIAVKAALTGHLVLSTLHTNDAAGAVTRLMDMGIQPFLLASSLIMSQAQRLYRKLCPACKKPSPLDPNILEANHIDPHFFDGVQIFEPQGCPKCTKGFKGRGAIMEVLSVDEIIRPLILRGANSSEIRTLAVDKVGMLTLKTVGMMKVKAGITSMAAALEVTGGE